MATTSKVQVKLKLTNGKSAVMNLAAPRNMTLTDEDTGEAVYPAAFNAIAAAYATDDGDTVTSADFTIIKTTVTEIATNYAGA